MKCPRAQMDAHALLGAPAGGGPACECRSGAGHQAVVGGLATGAVPLDAKLVTIPVWQFAAAVLAALVLIRRHRAGRRR